MYTFKCQYVSYSGSVDKSVQQGRKAECYRGLKIESPETSLQMLQIK